MFKTARLRLTLWYLMIIMMVSIIFSLTIFQLQGREVERFARQRLIRTQLQMYHGVLPPYFSSDTMLPRLEQDLIRDSEEHILLSLFTANGVILVFSGCLAYFLAGKTLQPIQRMVEEQHRFISDASHELRTPLTALKTSLEVTLRDKQLTLPAARKIISDSVQDVNQLQSLSENLLQLTQYQKQNGTVELKPVALDQVIREAVRQVEPLSRKKKISLNMDIRPCTIMGSSYSLIDLVVILLDNAIKYSGKSTHVHVYLRTKDRLAEMTIQDEGMGIAQKDIPHIFNRFYRADSARSKLSGGGYGLGLSIAKQIVELHHGQIRAVSRPGKGATFIVTLPVKLK